MTTLAVGGLLFIACVSGQSLDEGGGEAGAANLSGSAGTGTGSGGAAPSGGATQGGNGGQTGSGGAVTGGAFPTGGTATGGAFPTGGTATGGAFPTGGTATGGAFPTGGTATGGTATGGTATGGTAGRGGTSTGGTSTGGTATGGTGGTVAPPPNINGGQQAWASRYWDCCKPACGWTDNVRTGSAMQSCSQSNQSLGSNFGARNACESGGTAFMCWNGAPWSVGGQLSYGFAAASGPNYVCGRCFHIQFNGTGHSGTNPGVQAINGKHMIIQIINNGGVAQDQFDLLIPGGGVGALNACDDQWSGATLGAQYGGFRTTCNGDVNCVRQMCQSAFSNKPELMAGCEWYIGWFGAADNPNFTYERIACPSALTQRSGLSDPG